ncbi:MAG: hypothetical protein WBG90_13205 [Saonia sp.]
MNENAEIAIVGHSHLMLGIDKERIEEEFDIKVSKYTREGVNVTDRYIMLQQLLESNEQMKTLIYGVDAWTFTNKGLSSNSYKLFYPFLDSRAVKDYVYAHSSPIDYMAKRIIRTTRYDELLLSGSVRGYLGEWTNLKFGKVDVEGLKTNIANGNFRKIKNARENIRVFRETLELLAENNIRVILLYVPTIDLLTEVQELEYGDTLRFIEEISGEFNNVEFLNLQGPMSHDHTLFYDAIHLNPEGQAIATQELISYIGSRNDPDSINTLIP